LGDVLVASSPRRPAHPVFSRVRLVLHDGQMAMSATDPLAQQDSVSLEASPTGR
jgi:hypothetical protein